MTGDRHTLRIANEAVRERAVRWIKAAPLGWFVEFQAPRRTSEQSDRMWAMLSDIAKQRDHFGKKYPKEAWKLIFLSALGHEVQFAPALNGNGLVPLGASSRKLTKSEMSDMIELLFQQGAEWGIRWSDPTLIQTEAGAA